VAHLPTARAHASAAVVDGDIYVLGGSSNVYHKTIVQFDPATSQVATMAATLPSGRHLMGAAADDATIFLFGGWGGGQYHDKVLAYAPALAPPLRATPAAGVEHAVGSFTLTVPPRWQRIATGLPGEAGRFTTDTDVLVVQRARGSVFLTADSYADTVGGPERRGMTDLRSERDVVRAGELVLVDDRAIGRYEGRRIVLRLFTTVAGPQALALVFRYIEPADERAALAEAAAIAATWRLHD
jgi:hypothetical protein